MAPPAKKPELPSTLKRSPKKAQRTYEKTLESAEETYDGDEARAHRTAFAAVKHSFEKVGDHWEPKDEKGPSDPRSTKTGAAARRGEGETYGGVDVLGSTKVELLAKARDAEVRGRSSMTKGELAEALQKANDRATAKAREKG
jgi:cation transport regulator ChaB